MNNDRPLVSAGLLLGAGLGGFLDGIVFHQILQLHSMFSARLPLDNIVSIKFNMFWDGVFHAAVWVMTCLGIALLFRAARIPAVSWSARVLIGAMLCGWGLFNFIEGVIDHHVLGLHHVVEAASNPLPFDLAFLASGVLMLAVGLAMLRRSRGAGGAPAATSAARA